MALPAIRWAWRQQVEGNAKLVLLCLGWTADTSWSVRISIARIADECGISERTVQRALKTLRQAALVELVHTEQQSHYAVPTYQLRGDKLAPYTTTTVVPGDKLAPYTTTTVVLGDKLAPLPTKSSFHRAIDAAYQRGVHAGKKLALSGLRQKQVHP